MSFRDITIILLIAVAAVFAIRGHIKRRKNGCCDGNCDGCNLKCKNKKDEM